MGFVDFIFRRGILAGDGSPGWDVQVAEVKHGQTRP